MNAMSVPRLSVIILCNCGVLNFTKDILLALCSIIILCFHVLLFSTCVALAKL